MLDTPTIMTLFALLCPAGQHECKPIANEHYSNGGQCFDKLDELRDRYGPDLIAVCVDPSAFRQKETSEWAPE